MRWFGGLFGLLVVAFVIGGIGVAAYQTGFDNGFSDGAVETAAAAAEGSPVIVRDGGRHAGGFFPIGFFGIIFAWFLLMGVMKAIFFGRRGGPGGRGGPWGHRRGEWRERAREVHDEWHRGGDSPEGGTRAESSV